MVTRSLDGVERDYLLLEYKGGDRLYIPTDQIDAVRHYTGGDTPALHRLGGSDFAPHEGAGQGRGARDRAGAGRALPAPGDVTGPRVRPGHAVAARDGGSVPVRSRRPISCKAIEDVKADMEDGAPMDRLVCGDVGFGKTEVAIRAAFKAVQDGKQVGGARAHDAAREAARRDVRRALRRLPGAGRGAVALPHAGAGQGGRRRRGERRGRRRDRHPSAPLRGRAVQATSACSSSTRSSASASAQGGDQAAEDRRRRAHAHRHADPAHPRDEPHRHPRPHAAEHAARGSPADPHLRRRVRRPGRRRGDPPRAAARGPGVLRAQPGAGHRAGRGRASATWCPRRGSRSRTGRWTRARSSRWCSTSGRAQFDVLVCTTIIESGIDMPTVNTLVVDRADLLGLGQLHQLRGRVGRAGQRAYAYLFHPARPRAHRGGVRAAARRSASPPSSARGSRSPCATSRSAAPATCSAPARAATSPRSATTSTARWSPRRSPS